MLLFSATTVRTFAQDIIHYMDNSRVETKVLEIGIDSIKYQSVAAPDSPSQSVPKVFVKYIEYANGEKYFIEHSMLYLVNGKILIAHIIEYDEQKVQYQDVYTHRTRTIPTRKVAAIQLNDDERINFLDKINLWDGGYLAGQVLEIQEETISFKNVAKKNREQKIDRQKIRSIEFRNGFEQVFNPPQPND